VLSHQNLESQTGCLLSAWGWGPQDRILHVLPLHHTHGIGKQRSLTLFMYYVMGKPLS
jgi:hypothetical protein